MHTMGILFQRYKSAGLDTIILAGAEYGSGSSRDWAAKGPMLLVSLFICLVTYFCSLFRFCLGTCFTCYLFAKISQLLPQGVKAVIAKSFERIHRSNLVGMGIIPLCFKAGEDADTLELTGHERYNIDIPSKITEIRPGQDVTVTTDTGKSFICTVRFDTEVLPALLFFIYIHLIFYLKMLQGTAFNWLRAPNNCL